MNQYHVRVNFSGHGTVIVNADSEEEALKMAEDGFENDSRFEWEWDVNDCEIDSDWGEVEDEAGILN